jgi:hypothetical protein
MRLTLDEALQFGGSAIDVHLSRTQQFRDGCQDGGAVHALLAATFGGAAYDGLRRHSWSPYQRQ